MDDLLKQTKKALKSHSLKVRPTLGQNFLIDPAAIEKLVNAAEPRPDDIFLEVGPGLGFVTEKIIPKVQHLYAIELDPYLLKFLRQKFNPSPNLSLISADILTLNLPKFIRQHQITAYKIISSLPYYVTSRFLRLISETEIPPRQTTLLIQKEVAARVVSDPPNSLLALTTQFYHQVNYLDTIPADSFYPPPEVDGGIINLTRRDQPAIPADPQKFFALAKITFAGRRKQLHNTLAAGLRLDKSTLQTRLEKLNLDQRRPESLSWPDWRRLYQEFVPDLPARTKK